MATVTKYKSKSGIEFETQAACTEWDDVAAELDKVLVKLDTVAIPAKLKLAAKDYCWKKMSEAISKK